MAIERHLSTAGAQRPGRGVKDVVAFDALTQKVGPFSSVPAARGCTRMFARAGAANTGFDLTVTDTVSGQSVIWSNPASLRFPPDRGGFHFLDVVSVTVRTGMSETCSGPV